MVEIITAYPDYTLIIGNGVYGFLECPDSVIEYLRQKGIAEIIIEKIPNACKIYNQLFKEDKKVSLSNISIEYTNNYVAFTTDFYCSKILRVIHHWEYMATSVIAFCLRKIEIQGTPENNSFLYSIF